MSNLTILSFPDPRLRTVATEISSITSDHRILANNMLETMYQAEGIGLAATQVNVHERLIVMDLSEKRNEPITLINPVIITSGGSVDGNEGCLSVPGQQADIPRFEWIKCKALDLDGKEFEIEAEGLLAVCIQHEIDHLNGKLFVDYLSKLKRDRIRKKLEKLKN